jgi:hypothetical protein
MKTIDKFGELGVVTRNVETRKVASWTRTMCSITKRASRELIVAECTSSLEGDYNERLKIFTDGSLKDERVGYAIVTPETTIKTK